MTPPEAALGVRRRAAAITAVDTTARTATVQWADALTLTAGVPYLSSYLPTVGAVVLVDFVAGSPLIIGAASASARHGCRLRRVANQSVTATVQATISWDTEDQDTDGYIAATGTTVTIPAGLGGLYAVTAFATGSISGGTRAFIDIIPVTAVTGTPANLRMTAFPTENRYLIAATLPLLAADTFTVQVFYTGIAGPVNHTAWLSCYRIGE